MTGKKIAKPICDLAEGTRQALNLAGDVAIDSAVGITIAAAATALPAASAPAIVASSLVGQTLFSTLLSGITNPVHDVLHDVTQKIIPEGCKAAPVVIPMGEEPKACSAEPKIVKETKKNVNARAPGKKTNIQTINQLFINMGIPESEVEKIIKENDEKLTEINEKLDNVLNYIEKQDQQEALNSKLDTLKGGIELCGAIANFARVVGCPELQKAANIVGGGLQLGLGIAMCWVNPIMGVGMIFNGLSSLFGSILGGGPDPHEVILKEIGKISERLSEMHQDMFNLFEVNFKMQKIILDTIQEGFGLLSRQVAGQVGSFRAEVKAALHRIENLQVDILKDNDIASQQLYGKDYLNLQSRVEDGVNGRFSKDGFSSPVSYTANELSVWATKHAASPLLNKSKYRGFKSLSENRAVLDQVLTESPEKNAVQIMGYFEPSLVNPLMWFDTVMQYAQFTEHFWNIDFDENQRESIAKKGVEIIKFCDDLENNKDLWDQLVGDYYRELDDVKADIDDLVNRRNDIWTSSHDESYSAQEKRKLDNDESANIQAGVKSFDFVRGDVEGLMAKFEGRMPKSISVSTLSNNRIQAIRNGKEIDIKGLENLHSRKMYRDAHLTREILCAEYLGLVNEISFEQTGSLQGLSKEPTTSPDSPKEYQILLLTESPQALAVSDEWKLSFDMHLQFKNCPKQKTKKVTYHNAWKNMGKLKKFWDNNVKRLPWEEDGIKFFNEHIDLIKDNFKKSTALQADIEGGIGSDLSRQARELITENVIQKRQELAAMIVADEDKEDTATRTILNKLEQRLVKLDLYERRLRHYLYLSGKDLSSPEGKKIADSLINRRAIFEKLIKYIQEKDRSKLGLKEPEWLTMLTEALDETKRFSTDKLLALPNYKQLPQLHPKQVAQQGVLRLAISEQSREYYRLKFPLYAHYIDLKEYRERKNQLFIEEALKEIYDILKDEVLAQKYKESCNAIKSGQILSVSEKRYQEIFYTFYNWAIKTAAETTFVGTQDWVGKNKPESERYQTLVGLKISRHWSTNISTLYAIACEPKAAESLPKMVNHVMWQDGVRHILKMLAKPELEKVSMGLIAKEQRVHDLAKDSEKRELLKIESLEQFYKSGNALYKTIEKIAVSGVVSKLLAHYESTLEQMVALAEQNSGLSDKNLYNLLIGTTFAGSSIKLIDSLDADLTLIQRYSEMTLGYFDIDKILEIFKNKEKFLEIIEVEKDKKIVDKLKLYKAAVIKSKEQLSDIYSQLEETVLFRSEILKLSRGESSSYFSIKGSTLVINSTKFKFGFDEAKSNILSSFLSQAKGITGLVFEGEDFSYSDNLKFALTLVKKHPELSYLGLSDSSLSAEVIAECRDEFSALKSLRYLDLSKNKIVGDDMFQAQSQVWSLIDLLKSMPFLKILNLASTGMSSSTRKTMQDFWEHKTVSTVMDYEPFKFISHVSSVDLKNIQIERGVNVGPLELEKTLITLKEMKAGLLQRNEANNSKDLKPVMFGCLKPTMFAPKRASVNAETQTARISCEM